MTNARSNVEHVCEATRWAFNDACTASLKRVGESEKKNVECCLMMPNPTKFVDRFLRAGRGEEAKAMSKNGNGEKFSARKWADY